jgi:hypothetical protein
VAKAIPAVGLVRVDFTNVIGYGTGFLVDSKGDTVTNRHVVMDEGETGSSFHVRTAGGRMLTAKLIGNSKRYDIAVLRVRGLRAKPLGWLSKKPKIGQGVLALGFPAVPMRGIACPPPRGSLVDSAGTTPTPWTGAVHEPAPWRPHRARCGAGLVRSGAGSARYVPGQHPRVSARPTT